MAEKILLGFGFLIVCCLVEVSSRPNNEASTEYLPFYGGAKGQYLEIKKDNGGAVVSEKIVSEENVSSDSTIKNSNTNLLSKAFTANLQNLKTLTAALIKLNNVLKKYGYFPSDNDKAKFLGHISSLKETASNTVKLVDEIGDDVTVLYKKPSLRDFEDENEEDVGEEGISIGLPDESSEEDERKGTIVVAKPVGLAVIGEKGLAGSRPKATAIAQRGVALARPSATAIGGFDPSILGIDFNINQREAPIRKGGKFKRFFDY